MRQILFSGIRLFGTFQEELAECLQCTESLGRKNLEPHQDQFHASMVHDPRMHGLRRRWEE